MSKPWKKPMPPDEFEVMRDVLAAPSPVGFEAAMTHGVIMPYFKTFAPKGWKTHQYRGNAGIVLDTHPGKDEMFTVMIIGHADKIRMQVRSIGDDGKLWIDSDSFLPSTLIGHEVRLFSRDPQKPGAYRVLDGATIEAVGAIHFADNALRSGDRGIKKEMLYAELQLTGEDRKKQVEDLGIQPGDAIILNRPIKRGFAPESFYGAYLDNGLGSYVTADVARLVAKGQGLKYVRCLFAIAAWEEIGRLGSRVLVQEHRPDVVVGVDVAHDYMAAPGVSEKRFTPTEMGKGYVLSVGSIVSEYLNTLFIEASDKKEIPYQIAVKGRDTGTDAMAAVFAAVDAAATSIGIPIRNMHTISETGHTSDVLAASHGIFETLKLMDKKKVSAKDFREGHPRLDESAPLTSTS